MVKLTLFGIHRITDEVILLELLALHAQPTETGIVGGSLSEASHLTAFLKCPMIFHFLPEVLKFLV